MPCMTTDLVTIDPNQVIGGDARYINNVIKNTSTNSVLSNVRITETGAFDGRGFTGTLEILQSTIGIVKIESGRYYMPLDALYTHNTDMEIRSKTTSKNKSDWGDKFLEIESDGSSITIYPKSITIYEGDFLSLNTRITTNNSYQCIAYLLLDRFVKAN